MEREISLFETSWPQLAEIAMAAVAVYFAVIVVVRVNGARTTSELNSFDWIINVVVGSIAASGILLEDISLPAALTAIVVLTALQYMLTRLTRASRKVSAVVKDEPVLLTHKGRYLQQAMTQTRISQDEILGVLRSHGYTSVEDANWVILETNGSLSVIPRDDSIALGNAEALQNVSKPGLEGAEREAA